jgi:hypothetical protein
MRLIEFKDEYAKLINMMYGELNADQKRAVYAMEIYNDSGDALIACDIFADLPPDRLDPDFIDEQLRNTFGYTDATIIE